MQSSQSLVSFWTLPIKPDFPLNLPTLHRLLPTLLPLWLAVFVCSYLWLSPGPGLAASSDSCQVTPSADPGCAGRSLSSRYPPSNMLPSSTGSHPLTLMDGKSSLSQKWLEETWEMIPTQGSQAAHPECFEDVINPKGNFTCFRI